MRTVIEQQMKIGESDISEIQFDLQSRDEILKLLIGLQTIFTTPELRDPVFDLLENLTPPCVNPEVG